MKVRQINQVLLLSAITTLALGFSYESIWILSGLIGLIPALYSLVRDLRQKTMGSDLLAVISLFATLLTHELFAASIIALMLATGRMLESRAVGQAERQLKSLISRMPRIANRIETSGSIEKITQIAIEEIRIGDRILVRGGEITPCDGNLLGTATLDESALTGEPLPVQRVQNDSVSSGVLNAGAPFEFVASSTAENSTYEGIIKLVKAAQAKSAPGVRLANTWALRFVPIALSVAALAWIITGEVDRAVAVLVAATPCPLILAVPIAIVAGLSQSAKNGAIVKGGAILELLSRTQTVLLDKTGTLTHGGPVISQIASAPNYTKDQVLQIAASLDQYSPHMVAKSIVKFAKSKEIQISTCTNLEEVAGHQISGVLNGVQTTVGQLTVEKPTLLDF